MFNIGCVHPLELEKKCIFKKGYPSILGAKLFGNEVGLDPLFQKIVWEFFFKCEKTNLLMFGCRHWINS